MKSTISFVVTGIPVNIKKFLIEIENMDRATLMHSVTLTTEKGPTGNPSLKAAGQISFYFYKENET